MTDYRISAGFMPLMDCLIPVIAREKGFAEAQGIDLNLVRETSWANIRDRIAVGHFDVAHMLAPMPLAAALGLNPISAEVVVPFALGLNGNAITVSVALWRKMREKGATLDLDPSSVGSALAQVIGGGERPRFAVVHQHSAQNYELRYWLVACGIDPSRDVEMVVVPPPLMTDALKAGVIDGHCVADPWGSASVVAGAGVIATTKSKIWKSGPEKVLGASARWAQAHPDALSALLRALHAAAAWCGESANCDEAASILAKPNYLGLPQDLNVRGLRGILEVERGRSLVVPDFFVPFAHDANYPWPEHAHWFYDQMVRWGDIARSPEREARATGCYRPDLYRAALGAPAASQAGQSFFDMVSRA